MQKKTLQEAENFLARNQRRRTWKKIVSILACIVVFCITYALILPAITLEETTWCGITEHTHSKSCYTQKVSNEVSSEALSAEAKPLCTMERPDIHKHTEDCYDKKKGLVCGYSDFVVHEHDSACYDADGKLWCEFPEIKAHTHSKSCYEDKNKEETHIHTDECYTMNRGKLICTKGENAGHTHSQEAGCYDENGELVCKIEEKGGHRHTDECYEWEKELICKLSDEPIEPKLICDKEEIILHEHRSDCYDKDNNLICGKQQVLEHQHTDACCYEEEQLACGLDEHTHDLSCYSNPKADVETQDVWEESIASVTLTGKWPEDVIAIAKSQLGYTESDKNYAVAKDGNTKKGYTRYGAWYGDVYGNWSAMFVSFCLNYAGVEDFPLEASCSKWTKALQDESVGLYHNNTDYTPKQGDLIFFDTDADQEAERVGLISEIRKGTDEKSQQIITIEGDSDNCVQCVTYDTEDSLIMGYGELPEHTSRRNLSFEGEDYTIRVYFTSEAKIPKNAQLSVRELTGEEYEESCKQAKEKMGVDDLSFARFFDISFMSDGKKIEPAAPVNVEITYADHVEIEKDQVKRAVHFTKDGTELLDAETEQKETGDTVFSFTQDSFSVVGTAVSSRAARASTRPSTQTGSHTNTLEVDEWYILYAIGDDNMGYAISAENPTRAVKLDEASINRGTVSCSSSEDVLWEYTEGGFRNARGEYLALEHIVGSWNQSSVGLSIDPHYVTYDAEYHLLYNRHQIGIVTWYNSIWENLWGEGNSSFAGWSSRSISTPKDGYHYIARVFNSGSSTSSRHPMGSVTGTPGGSKLVLYNIDASENDTPKPLEGVEYTIYKADSSGKKGEVIKTITTMNSFDLPVGKLDAGTYIVEQTGVPEGYIVYPQTRKFTVDQDGQATIGVFYDYKAGEEGFITDKTAQVVDYINRTYEINLSAASGKYGYTLDTLNFSLVVDQSNSMLFPAELTDTGKSVTLYKEPDKAASSWWESAELDRNNAALNDPRLDLDKNQVYYIISDEDVTSTVWAIWYDHANEGWCYQDASFYAKAQFYHDLGTETNAKEGDNFVSFAQFGDEFNKGNHGGYPATNGGGFDKTLGSTLGVETVDGNPYKIYTGSEYNRLHELQEGVSILANLLGSLNENTTMELVTFCRTVDTNHQPISLNNNGIKKVIEAVDIISTSGGTRQDLALDHVKDHDIQAGKDNFVILVTDGAPSGVKTDGAKVTTQDVLNSATALKGENNVTLVTVGLSMDNVKGGSTMLESSASDKPDGGKWCYKANKSGDLANLMVEQIFKSIAKTKLSTTTSMIQDTISDSFYPINPDTKEPLTSGTWIDLEGHVINNPTSEQKKQAGQVLYDSEKKEWRVEWSDQTLPIAGDQETQVQPKVGDIIGKRSDGSYYIWSQGDNSNERIGKVVSDYNGLRVDKRGYISYSWGDRYMSLDGIKITATEKGSSWHGRLYVKAKEDFIGGNAIDTNKSASITLKDGDQIGAQAFEMETPTVNVRLMPIDEYNSEETVFLGDEVNPEKRIKALLDQIHFTKIKKNTGDAVYNRVAAADAEGLEADSYTLAYAMQQELTEEQWKDLISGKSVNVDYTYDDASSHGAVGYFTFTLEKKQGQVSDYNAHRTKTTGKEVETYTLKVTYTAYHLGETDTSQKKRPDATVHNGSNGPGTEVGGTEAGDTLETGYGTLSSTNTHKVHVVDGKITVIKEVDEKLKSNKDQTFKFTLQRQNDSGEYVDVTDTNGNPVTLDVIVNAQQTEGTATIDTLPRGIYRLVEEVSENYTVKDMTVVDGEGKTNCKSSGSGTKEVIFTIGTDKDETDVIKSGTVPTYSTLRGETPATTEACKSVSYGTVKVVNEKTTYTAELPVKKSWDPNLDSSEYSKKTVYVALYQNDAPVKDTNDRILAIALNQDNQWKGNFTVALETNGQNVAELGYSIRELSGVVEKASDDAKNPAVVTNDRDRVVYYDTVAENGLVNVGDTSYLVSYEGNLADGKPLAVTNSKAYRLPETGGAGTTTIYISGLLLIALSGVLTKVRRERNK